jgi:alpha-glucoside transport system substrate-binding protein
MRRVRWLLILMAFVLVGAACSDNGETTTPTTGGGASGGVSQGANTGEVTVLNAMEPEENTAVQAIVDDLITPNVDYQAELEQSGDFEEQIKIRVDGGNPPDIAMYPQPASVVEQAKAGKIVALEDLGVDMNLMNETFGEYLMSLGEYNGKHYGVPTNINLKSMIWYPKAAFDAKGYTVPKTWDELIALSDQIVADSAGTDAAPWCVGFESGGATGWPATDWMEDIMLRTAGPDVYDQWQTHEIPFNDPAVVTAGQDFGQIMFGDGYVLGGADQTPNIAFGDAPTPMFNDPPTCWLHRQASFINAFFPEDAVAGVDYDWFPFPTISDPSQQAALFGGELSAVFRNAPEVKDFVERFAAQDVQCAQGGVTASSRISPNVNVGPDCYANDLLAGASDILITAIKAGNGRFDASDLMPSAVGSGSFWTGMVEYMQGGPDSLQGVLDDIEASWPAS